MSVTGRINEMEEELEYTILKHCACCRTVVDGDKRISMDEFIANYDQEKYRLTSGMHSQECIRPYIEDAGLKMDKYMHLPVRCND